MNMANSRETNKDATVSVCMRLRIGILIGANSTPRNVQHDCFSTYEKKRAKIEHTHRDTRIEGRREVITRITNNTHFSKLYKIVRSMERPGRHMFYQFSHRLSSANFSVQISSNNKDD